MFSVESGLAVSSAEAIFSLCVKENELLEDQKQPVLFSVNTVSPMIH